MNESFQHITKELQQVRKKSKLSQKELGIRVGLPQSHISKIEQGKVDLQLSSLIQLARVLDLEIMLIPRTLLVTVRALLRENTSLKNTQVPAYHLEEDNND